MDHGSTDRATHRPTDPPTDPPTSAPAPGPRRRVRRWRYGTAVQAARMLDAIARAGEPRPDPQHRGAGTQARRA